MQENSFTQRNLFKFFALPVKHFIGLEITILGHIWSFECVTRLPTASEIVYMICKYFHRLTQVKSSCQTSFVFLKRKPV